MINLLEPFSIENTGITTAEIEDTVDAEEIQYQKKCPEDILQYVLDQGCRRDFFDAFFDNPKRQSIIII